MNKIEYPTWQYYTSLSTEAVVTPRYISTSLKRKFRNNVDVIDYFAGGDEIYE